jgi:heme a synthase
MAATSTTATAATATTNAIAAGLSPPARRALALWLGGCAAWTASMVAFGGATRLTRSGLSMTDWKFTGEAPPRTHEDWEAEFDKYKRSPEYRRVNR